MSQQKTSFENETTEDIITPDPAQLCVLVIFGISGDLTKRLLYPALCNLGIRGLLDEKFSIVGIAIEPYTTESFREHLVKNIEVFVKDNEAKEYGLKLAERVYYYSSQFSESSCLPKLKREITRT